MLPVRDFFSEQLQQHQASLRRTEAVVADGNLSRGNLDFVR